jgi:hypothetical protein
MRGLLFWHICLAFSVSPCLPAPNPPPNHASCMRSRLSSGHQSTDLPERVCTGARMLRELPLLRKDASASPSRAEAALGARLTPTLPTGASSSPRGGSMGRRPTRRRTSSAVTATLMRPPAGVGVRGVVGGCSGGPCRDAGGAVSLMHGNAASGYACHFPRAAGSPQAPRCLRRKGVHRRGPPAPPTYERGELVAEEGHRNGGQHGTCNRQHHKQGVAQHVAPGDLAWGGGGWRQARGVGQC